jgi:hypothetical protein
MAHPSHTAPQTTRSNDPTTQQSRRSIKQVLCSTLGCAGQPVTAPAPARLPCNGPLRWRLKELRLRRGIAATDTSFTINRLSW